MLEPMEPPYTRPGSAELAIFLSGVTRGWDPAEDGSAAACSAAVRSFVPITPLAAAGAGHYHHMPRCVVCAAVLQ